MGAGNDSYWLPDAFATSSSLFRLASLKADAGGPEPGAVADGSSILLAVRARSSPACPS